MTTRISPQWAPRLVLAVLLALGVAACGSNPGQGASSGPPKSDLQFVDLQGFDRDLYGSLSAPLPQVDVAFYDRITPSTMPDRLQTWMAAVEKGGGKVTIVPPKPTVTAKDPFLLISIVTSLWSASKMAREMSTKAQFAAAEAYDAQILLKHDDRGDSVVDKVVFVQRKK
jgi:hypothetical protein